MKNTKTLKTSIVYRAPNTLTQFYDFLIVIILPLLWRKNASSFLLSRRILFIVKHALTGGLNIQNAIHARSSFSVSLPTTITSSYDFRFLNFKGSIRK